MLARCLILFNLVFLGQHTLDAWYLLGGGSLPKGMSYAEYAHSGAYPLVATALLAGAFVLLAFRADREHRPGVWSRRLVQLWILQNVVLVATAGYRLGLYVKAYSLTRWRVAAGIWMAMVAVGLVLLVWRVLADQDNRWLLQRIAGVALVVLYAGSFVNFNGLIASYNVAHARSSAAPARRSTWITSTHWAQPPCWRWLDSTMRSRSRATPSFRKRWLDIADRCGPTFGPTWQTGGDGPGSDPR